MSSTVGAARRERVHVFCRERPPMARPSNGGGMGAGAGDALTFLTGDDDAGVSALQNCSNKGNVELVRSGGATRGYKFDGYLSPGCSQAEVYAAAGNPVVKGFLAGYNGTIFAYGQTGSGKTYTMLGPDAEPAVDEDGAEEAKDEAGEDGEPSILQDKVHRGLIPRVLDNIFHGAEEDEDHDYKFYISYVQIYCELLTDLLAPESQSLSIREDQSGSVSIQGAARYSVFSTQDCLSLLYAGHKNRVTASTRMNATSSRSHAVLVMYCEKRPSEAAIAATPPKRRGAPPATGLTKGKLVHSSLFLVDLAGSERVKRSGAAGTRFNELKAINLSLSALGNCISALAAKRSHIPFRDSKLTRLLQGSLGGNAKTSLIVTVTGDGADVTETQSTLEFGQRARKVQVRAVVNMVTDYKLLYESLQSRVDKEADAATKLKLQLQQVTQENQRLKEALETSQSELKGMRAELKAALGSAAASEDVLKGLDLSDGNVSAGMLLDKIKASFQAQLQDVHESHAAEKKELEDRLEARIVNQAMLADDANHRVENIEQENRTHKDELIEVLEENRMTRERVEELEGRLGEMMAELEISKEAQDSQRHELEDADKRIESAENAMASLMERVKKDFISKVQVAEMQRLYEASIERLSKRVDQLEVNTPEPGASRSAVPAGVARRDWRSAIDAPADAAQDALARKRSTSRERLVSLHGQSSRGGGAASAAAAASGSRYTAAPAQGAGYRAAPGSQSSAGYRAAPGSQSSAGYRAAPDRQNGGSYRRRGSGDAPPASSGYGGGSQSSAGYRRAGAGGSGSGGAFATAGGAAGGGAAGGGTAGAAGASRAPRRSAGARQDGVDPAARAMLANLIGDSGYRDPGPRARAPADMRSRRK